MPDPSREGASDVVRTLKRAGHEAYLVGGCVRDILLGSAPEDYDIATSARPEEVRGLFEHTVPVGEAFGVILVVEDDVPYEVATFRTEGPYEDGRRPSSVAFTTAEEDVKRRDFTVNGLLLDVDTGEILDFVGGRADIERRIIRTIGDPERRLSEDHLRMLRAVRLEAQLAFDIEPATFEAIRRLAPAIRRVSSERIRDELERILASGRARRAFERLSESGLLEEILPELAATRGVGQPTEYHPEGDLWVHILLMLEKLPPGADTRLGWGVLMHDVGKPLTFSEDKNGIHFYEHSRLGTEMAEEILRRLRFPRAHMETVTELVRHHMRFMHVKQMRPSTLKRLLRMPEFDLHLELHRLDCLASHGDLENYEFCRRQLDGLVEEELRPPRLLTGDDLIAMGFKPGPVFSEILKAVEDAQLEGEITAAEQAREMVLARWGDRG